MIGRPAQGFTLLEVILALGMTGLILVALGMAIDFHFRVLDTGRAHVEEGQLARVLLRRIADDLRAAVYSAGNDTDVGTDDSQASDASEQTVVHAKPGIYGDNSLIQIDVSRLPRPYQLQELIVSGDNSLDANSLSDVKTVTYFAASSQSTAISLLPLSSMPEQGLMRCEMDRAVAVYQAEQGGLSPLDANAVLLAPEVAGVEFLYFDGSQWVDFWDTSQNGGLPVAVRVTLYITPKQTKQRRGPASQEATVAAGEATSVGESLAYSLLVNIPVAQAGLTGGASLSTGAGTSEGGSGSATGGAGSSGSSSSGGASAGTGGNRATGGDGGGTGGTGGGTGGTGGSDRGGGGGRKS